MKKIEKKYANIPIIIWNDQSSKVIIAIHGLLSNKEDTPIEILADVAKEENYQIISFDLPNEQNEYINFDNIKECLIQILNYAKKNWSEISLFACNIGVYYSLLYYNKEEFKQVFFLSPILSMENLLNNMMEEEKISVEELKSRGRIITNKGTLFSIDYYNYVINNKIDEWNSNTFILYGLKDEVIERKTVIDFMQKFNCEVKMIGCAKHYFNSEEELENLDKWFRDNIIKRRKTNNKKASKLKKN